MNNRLARGDMMDIEKELRGIRQEMERIVAMGRPRPGLASRDEAAKFLGLSKATIDRMVDRGELRRAPLGDGKHPRIPWSELYRLTQPKAADKPRRGGPKRGVRHFDAAQEVEKARLARRQRTKRR